MMNFIHMKIITYYYHNFFPFFQGMAHSRVCLSNAAGKNWREVLLNGGMIAVFPEAYFFLLLSTGLVLGLRIGLYCVVYQLHYTYPNILPFYKNTLPLSLS